MPNSAFESIVREMLEGVARCDAGYADSAICAKCSDREACADILQMELKRKYPYAHWGSQINTVLGGRV